MENYFLCSKAVVDFAKPTEVSKPFKSGYQHDKEENYFVAVLDFDKMEEHYDKLTEDEQDKFWLKELTPGLMDVSTLSIKLMKENGLFFEIERKIGLTSTRNQAMTIHNLSEQFGCSPVEFINRVSSSK